MEDNLIKQRYPISKHNKQCLGPCYEPGTWVINPITLQYITDFDEPFCPTNIWEYKDPNTGKIRELPSDICYVPTHSKDISKEEIEMNILLPKIDFDTTQFLNIYYEIYSFEGILEWIDRYPKSPLYTKLRLIECGWKSYGNKLTILDDRVISFYQELIRKRWIKHVYPAVTEYIRVTNDQVIIDKKGTAPKAKDKKDKIKKVNYIIKNYTTSNKIHEFLTNYIKESKSEWQNIANHEKRMIRYYINYIIRDLRK